MKKFSFLMCNVLLASALGLVGSQGSASAAVITTTSVFAFSSQFNAGGHGAVQAVNGSGLDVTGLLHGPDNRWTTASQGDPATRAGEFLVIGLGGSYDLDGIDIWNYSSAPAARGVVDISIYISNVDSPNTDFTSSDWTEVPSVLDLTAPLLGSLNPATNYNITGTAQFVAVELLTFIGSNNVTGLAEVQVSGTVSVIPEPSSLSLIALGMFGLGGFGRRRR